MPFSNAYLLGFSKAAENIGVDACTLLKIAQKGTVAKVVGNAVGRAAKPAARSVSGGARRAGRMKPFWQNPWIATGLGTFGAGMTVGMKGRTGGRQQQGETQQTSPYLPYDPLNAFRFNETPWLVRPYYGAGHNWEYFLDPTTRYQYM